MVIVMCEFTVILDDEVVAEKVIKAKLKDGAVIMADTMGNITKIENAYIQKVDTIMTEMVLKRD